MSTCGFTSDEVQNFVNTDILPLIGPCQSQTEVYLEKLDVSFVSLILKNKSSLLLNYKLTIFYGCAASLGKFLNWFMSLLSCFIVHINLLQKAFESLAKTTADESKCLFGLMCGAAQLWEIHCKGLLSREQQLQNSLEVISQVHNQENQARLY